MTGAASQRRDADGRCGDGARVLVLGADGFIGRRVVSMLAASGWAVPVAVGRRRIEASSSIERLTLDATDHDAMLAAMRGAHGVVSCIAGSADTIVASAKALFQPVDGLPPPRIVYLSSMAAYGSAVGLVDESAPLNGDVGPYSSAKVISERLAQVAPNTVVLRPGIVYGPGSLQWTTRVAEWLRQRRIGDMGASGDGYCNLVYLDDVAAYTLAALRLPGLAGEAFNLASDDPPTWNEYFMRFARALGAVPVARISQRRLKIETTLLAPPLKIVEILASRLNLRDSPLPSPISPSLPRLWRQEIRLSISKARERLDVVQTPVAEGLDQAAAMYRRGHTTSTAIAQDVR